MSAYRSAAAPKPSIALLLRGQGALAIALLSTVFALAPLPFLDFVSIVCTRQGTSDEGTCTVHERSLFRWRDFDVPLRETIRLRVDERNSREGGGRLSRLVLVTTTKEIPFSNGWDNVDLDVRRRSVARFDEFRRSDAPRFEADGGTGSLGFGAFWIATCVVLIFVIRGRTVRVVIDPAAGAIRVRRWFRTIALPLSRDVAIVDAKHGQGNRAWLLVSPTRPPISLPLNVRLDDVAAFNAALAAALPET